MHNAKVKLSVVIPAYLEEENLRIILPRIVAVLKGLKISWEVLVVDTMTPMDGTAAVCKSSGVIYCPRVGGNRYGDAVRTGIAKAQGEFVVFMDADGSHSPEFIEKLYEHSGKNDVVIASRYINGGRTDNSRLLVLMSLMVNVIYSVVLNLRCKDVSNSFKLYRSEHLKKILLKCSNFDIVEEILFKLHRNNHNLRILEIPFSFKERMFGHTKRNLVIFVITYVLTILRLRFS